MIATHSMMPTWSQPLPPPVTRGTASPSPSVAVTDSVQLGSTEVIAKPQSLQQMAGAPQDKSSAIQMAGIGVMMTGMMVGATVGGPYGPAIMVGSMFAGLAIAEYGRRG